MPVYKFSHQLLAVLVHLAHTAVKWKTNFLILDVGDKLVNTDDTALIKYEKKFMSSWDSSFMARPIVWLVGIRASGDSRRWRSHLLTSSTQSPLQRNTSDMADIISSHW